jgi:hypothetical protein
MKQYVTHAYEILRETNRRGVQIPEEVIRTITQARAALPNQLDDEFEAKFWSAYGVLTSSIGPAESARKWYTVIFYVILVVVLFAQFCFLSLDYANKKINPPVSPAGGAGQATGVDQAKVAKIPTIDGAIISGEQIAYYKVGINALKFVGIGFMLSDTAGGEEYSASVRAQLDLMIIFFSSYLLPMLYGLLGACAFVLRKLSDPVDKLTYAHDARVRYSLRLTIGLLTGLAVGWFIKPGSGDTSLVSLSPLALAFVAGYGSDLFFAALDKIVQAFAPSNATSRSTVTESTTGGITARKEERKEIRVAGADTSEDADVEQPQPTATLQPLPMKRGNQTS